MAYDRELALALEAVRQAEAAVLEEYARFQLIADAPADISTEADHISQNIILKKLHQAFPDDALCAEETTEALANLPETGSRLWIVDPIDGTRGFARKNGEFSVMAALVEQGQIALGIVCEPARKRLTYAVREGGCWKQDGADEGAPGSVTGRGQPIRCRVSTCQNLPQATLVQSRSKNPSRQVKALQPARILETYSAGVKLAMVARGEADLYLNTYEAFHDWDICAGHILVQEAGGHVTGLGGQVLHYGLPGAWQRHGLLASNGRLHQAALQALKSIPFPSSP